MPFEHLDDGDVADACGFGDLAGGVACVVGGADAVAVLLHGGSAPLVGALHTGEGLHGLPAVAADAGVGEVVAGAVGAHAEFGAVEFAPFDHLAQAVHGLGGAGIVQGHGEAHCAGFVAEREVCALLGEVLLISGHGGSIGYRAGLVKGFV